MELQNFEGPSGEKIRVILKDGEPWFVSRDVCDALGIANGRDAVARLDDDEKGVGIFDTLGGPQQLSIIAESGFYTIAITSRKPEANEFRKWVMRDVLPQIRKTGGYNAIPQTFADALQLAADQQRQIQAQALQIEAARPAVDFVAKFVENATTQPLRAVAKVLKINERTFVSKLVEEGILYRLAGKLTPAARHMDAGRFEVKEIVAKNGHATTQMRFTPKGVEWIARKTQEWQEAE